MSLSRHKRGLCHLGWDPVGDVAGRCLKILRPWTSLVVRHPWSHNDAYGWWIAAQARRLRTPRPRSALDIGCGTGNLIARLVGVVDQVTGLEPDPATARVAVERFADDDRVRILQRSFDERPEGSWDLITMVAVLHHLPLEETLVALRPMIKPEGNAGRHPTRRRARPPRGPDLARPLLPLSADLAGTALSRLCPEQMARLSGQNLMSGISETPSVAVAAIGRR